MFRRIEDTMQADPSFSPNLQELGFFMNETGHIRMTNAPDKPFLYHATNNERINEVRREAFQICLRREVEKRLANIGLSRVYLPQFTASQPDEPSIPILAPTPETLKASKRVIVLVNDSTQDLGILSYGHLQREGGINAGSVVNFAKELIKRASTNTTEQDAEIFKDGYELEDKSAAPALIVMNTGQLLYSHKYRQPMTLRSWSALPRKSAVHDMIRIHEENSVSGHRTPIEHIQTIFDGILLNPERISPDAEIYLSAIENGTEHILNLLASDFPKYTSRLTALALVHCTLDDSQIKDPQLRSFLHTRARQWKFNDTTPDPLICTNLPKDYSGPRKLDLVAEMQDMALEDKKTAPEETEWASGKDVVCPSFGGGEEPLAEFVFTDGSVQEAVLGFFEEVRREGEGVDWEPQVEGPKVPFAGTMVESELLKAAGLMEEEQE
ncbi:uncharacterized protein yc1106_10068 [Curvularia clavata]|uniref:Arb2 domain-containing protein n=1 Tax=Curvularia clavata TaxID=95742 RepID=A0A9Q9DYB1_CURCL|nr:uncharacterized protein yc1106_10068 [Curvularia clavata]